MRASAIVVVIGACGGGAQTTPSPPSSPPQRAASEPTPAAICARITALHDAHCGFFTSLDFDASHCSNAFRNAQQGAPSTSRLALRGLGRCVVANQRCDEAQQCVAKIPYWVKPVQQAPSADAACARLDGPLAKCGYGIGHDHSGGCLGFMADHREILESSGHCVVDEGDDCEHVTDCMQDSVFDKTDLRACSDVDPGKAVGMLAADWARRNGAGVARYSAARSTKAAPLEVCGFIAENHWLIDAACDDGSHPIATRPQAEASRVGNEGTAGRCGSIVDLYRVKCPEATYELHIDAYVCPLTE
ncbi:MAG TPA: hypothetical protein VGL61_23825 [Kofleriaceae bacterium]